jgi:hypothetical protein
VLTACQVLHDLSHTLSPLFLFFCSTGVSTQGLYLEPLHQPFVVKDFFKIESH